MRTLRRAALLVLIACLTARPAAAKSISINMSITPEVRAGALAIRLKVSNTGDEAAGSVTPVVRMGDKEARGTRREALAPNESMEDTLNLPIGDLAAGRWPFRVAVDYTDANQYPFQALHVALVTVGNPSPARIALPEVKVAKLSDEGEMTAKVKNLSGEARKVRITAYVPEGLEVTSAAPEIDVEPWGEKTVTVDLKNRTALAGSRYPLFTSAEYDDQGTHYAVVGTGVVEIGASSPIVRPVLLYSGAALLAGWLVLIGWRLARRRA
jgi:hypothetical protein